MAGDGTPPPRVLFVCTGNICRSPMAERLVRSRAAAGAVIAESAGVAALVGRGMDEASADALRELGADPAGHEARQITDDLLRAADLVLTAEVEQRRVLLGRAPALLTRTFTMAEFARLAMSVDPTELRAVDPRARVRLVAAQRGRVRPPAEAEDDIADPYLRGPVIARDCAARIAAAIKPVIDALQP